MSHLLGPSAASDLLAAGFASLTVDDPTARRHFEQAYRLAEAADDQAGCAQCAAGMLLAMAMEYADFRGLGLWTARFLLAGAEAAPVSRPLDQLRLDAARITLPTLDGSFSFDAGTEAAAQRAVQALRELHEVPPDEGMLMFKLLLDYHVQQHAMPKMEQTIAFAQDHLRGGGVSPIWHARWWLVALLNHEYFSRPSLAGQALAELQALIARHGLQFVRFELACIEMHAALKADDLAQAERLFRELDGLRPAVRAGRLPQGLRAQGLYLARRGEYGAALERVQLLLALCADVEVPRRDQGAYECLRAYCLAALRRPGEALAVMASARRHQNGLQGEVAEAIIETLHAVRALDEAAPDAVAITCAALHHCAALRFTRLLLPLPAWAARLVEVGLDAGIEPEFLAATVRDRRLVPPDPTREAWPWRLHVFAFGPLRLLRDGLPLASLSAKAPRKPLELLRLLAAHGGGPLPVDAVIDQLWPSLEADAPKASFEMAVSRLRKLIDVPDAVRVVDNAVSLDRALVWVDVAAFDTLCRRGTAAAAEQALALYTAPLLGGEVMSGLMHTARERLALQHTGCVAASAEPLQASGQWAAAARLYEAALAHDPLAESLHRGLMRAQLQQGERAEALRSYQRLRDLLAQALRVTPSDQTEALAREAGAGSAGLAPAP